MKGRARDSDKRGTPSPINPALLAKPLDVIHEDNLREREICALLDTLSQQDTPDPGSVLRVLNFLRDDFPLHLADEAEDLFPLLRRRCAPEDQIGKAIERLTGDHAYAYCDTRVVIADLECLCTGDCVLCEDMRNRFACFAAHARRHLILENAIILPFARLRLTAHDLETLRLRMGQRRGLDRLKDTADAD